MEYLVISILFNVFSFVVCLVIFVYKLNLRMMELKHQIYNLNQEYIGHLDKVFSKLKEVKCKQD